jgi:hypothetical protein
MPHVQSRAVEIRDPCSLGVVGYVVQPSQGIRRHSDWVPGLIACCESGLFVAVVFHKYTGFRHVFVLRLYVTSGRLVEWTQAGAVALALDNVEPVHVRFGPAGVCTAPTLAITFAAIKWPAAAVPRTYEVTFQPSKTAAGCFDGCLGAAPVQDGGPDCISDLDNRLTRLVDVVPHHVGPDASSPVHWQRLQRAGLAKTTQRTLGVLQGLHQEHGTPWCITKPAVGIAQLPCGTLAVVVDGGDAAEGAPEVLAVYSKTSIVDWFMASRLRLAWVSTVLRGVERRRQAASPHLEHETPTCEYWKRRKVII